MDIGEMDVDFVRFINRLRPEYYMKQNGEIFWVTFKGFLSVLSSPFLYFCNHNAQTLSDETQ